MNDLQGTLYHLQDIFGNTVTHYSHQGYSDEGDEFWFSDDGHTVSGTEYTALVEESPSEETVSEPGFSDEAEMAIWLDQDIASPGDKFDYHGTSWVALSVSNMRVRDEFTRQLIGVRSIDG